MGCKSGIGDMSPAHMDIPNGNTYEIIIEEHDKIIVKVNHRHGIKTETHFTPRGIEMNQPEKGKREFKTDWSIRHKENGQA